MVAKNRSQPTAPYAHDDSIMELSLMLSRHQFDALEQRASSQGVSVAQFLRRLVYESTTDDAPSFATE
jgi:predicted DNA binding CopG/RHH family protein